MPVRCSSCGEKSDRGCIQLCRKCTGLPEVQYLGDSVAGPVIRNYRVALTDIMLLTLAELHEARKVVRLRRKKK